MAKIDQTAWMENLIHQTAARVNCRAEINKDKVIFYQDDSPKMMLAKIDNESYLEFLNRVIKGENV